MRYAELFAGAGGLSLGLEAAGFHAVAHAEIEPHARAVLRYRWPDTRLDGDVTKVNGADYAGITLLSGGSPCQDLSVAGKRAGLTGSRSSLFHEQCRIWRESGAPYLLWENVLGALSSNNGADFATVLSTIVGSTVAVPADGWRGGGGVVAGRDAVAAWRVLDLQHFGPPQRRVRVFVLAARAGGVDPAEVLALSEGVCGHPSPRQQSRESVAAGARGGVESGVVPIDMRQVRRGATNTKSGRGGESVTSGTPGTGIGESGDPSYTLGSEGGPPAVIAWDNELNASTEAHGPLMARGKSGGDRNGVLAFDTTQISGDVSPAIGRPTDGMGVLSFAENQKGETRLADVTQALAGGGGKPGQGYAAVLCTTGDVTHALTHEGADASEDGTEVLATLPASLGNSATGHNRDELIIAQHGQFNATFDFEVAPTLTCLHEQPYLVRREWPKQIADTLTVAYATKWGLEDQHINSGAGLFQPAATGRPRRLTPLECERLMSWPASWTATGRKEDGTKYALSDTARYRLCGNGVGSVCAEWIGKRLAAAITG